MGARIKYQTAERRTHSEFTQKFLAAVFLTLCQLELSSSPPPTHTSNFHDKYSKIYSFFVCGAAFAMSFSTLFPIFFVDCVHFPCRLIFFLRCWAEYTRYTRAAGRREKKKTNKFTIQIILQQFNYGTRLDSDDDVAIRMRMREGFAAARHLAWGKRTHTHIRPTNFSAWVKSVEFKCSKNGKLLEWWTMAKRHRRRGETSKKLRLLLSREQKDHDKLVTFFLIILIWHFYIICRRCHVVFQSCVRLVSLA